MEIILRTPPCNLGEMPDLSVLGGYCYVKFAPLDPKGRRFLDKNSCTWGIGFLKGIHRVPERDL